MKKSYLIAACLALASGCAEPSAESNDIDSDDVSVGQTEQALESVVYSDGEISAKLGWGRNEITNKFTSQCLDFHPIWDDKAKKWTTNTQYVGSGGGWGSADEVSRMTVEQVQKSLGLSVNSKASYGAYSGSLSASLSKSMSSSDLSYTMIFGMDLVTKTRTALQPDVKDAYASKGLDEFMNVCGDSFTQEVRYGGQFFLVVKLEFASITEKKAFEAKASFKASGVEVANALKSDSMSFSENTNIEMHAFQRGGNPAYLATAFSGKVDVKNEEGDVVGQSIASFNCKIDNLQACAAFITEAMDYATGTEPTDFVKNLNANPAIVSYVMSPWSAVANAPKIGSDGVPTRVRTARRDLLVAYRASEAALVRATFIKGHGYLGSIDPDFRKTVDAYVKAGAKNMTVISDHVDVCFDISPDRTAEELAACGELTENKLAGLKKLGFVPVDLDNLELPLVVHTKYGRKDFVTTKEPHAPVVDPSDTDPPTFPQWGEWLSLQTPKSSYTMCPAGQFAYGLSMKTEPHQGTGDYEDDTALNWVSMECGTWQRSGNAFPITPDVPATVDGKEFRTWGKWDLPAECESGPLVGVGIEIEPYQGRAKGHDDTGANKVSGICVSGETIQPTGGKGWGMPFQPAICPAGTAVCGFDLKFEPYQGNKVDDTGMNQISIACCKI